MHINRSGTEVVVHKVLFDLTDAADCALKHFFDEDALLWVHNLIVALLELAVDLDVLDVEHGVVGEPFLKAPQFTVLIKLKAKTQSS